jgi:hypothetical protein
VPRGHPGGHPRTAYRQGNTLISENLGLSSPTVVVPATGGRRYRAALGAVASLAVLLLGGVAGCGKSDPSTTGGSTPTKSPGPPTGLNAPDKIGSLIKSADQRRAQGELSDLKARQDVTAAVSTDYEDSTDKTHIITVDGEISTSPARWTVDDLDTDLQNSVDAGSPNKPVIVGTGNVGGVAKCISWANDILTKVGECDWTSAGASVFVHFDGFELAQATSLMPEILNATVKV